MCSTWDFPGARLSIAVPKNVDFQDISYLQGKKIATSYPNSLKDFLTENDIEAEIHEISGSVEIAPNIGLADAICDLVSSGSTLFKNGLKEVYKIFESQAILVANSGLCGEKQELLAQLVFRIKAVLAAKYNKYILLNAPEKCFGSDLSAFTGNEKSYHHAFTRKRMGVCSFGCE